MVVRINAARIAAWRAACLSWRIGDAVVGWHLEEDGGKLWK